MRRILILLATLALACAAFVAPVPTQARAAGAVYGEVVPGLIGADGKYVVYGHNFVPGEQLSVQVQPDDVTVAVGVDAAGNFSYSGVAANPSASYWWNVWRADGSLALVITERAPSITITPSTWQGSEPVIVRGTDFAANVTIALSVAPAGGGTSLSLGAAQTNEYGRFYWEGSLPSDSTKSVSWTVTAKGPTATATATYSTNGTASPPSLFHALATPRRVLDTRNDQPLGSATRVVPIADGRYADIPANATALVINLTAVDPAGPGYLTAYPTDAPRPNASNVNFLPGETTPNLVTVKVGTGGAVSLTNGNGYRVHALIDVLGYYTATDNTPGALVAFSPQRLLDTRTQTPGRLGPNGVVSLPVLGRAEVPTTGVAAVVLNLTVTDPTAAGYLAAYPTGATPQSSNVNFAPGETSPNAVIVKVASDGVVNIKNGSTGSSHVIVDIAGYYTAGSPTRPGAFVPVDPARIADTRLPGSPLPRLQANTTYDLTVAGRGGVPAGGAASAVIMNTTVTDPAGAGYLVASPQGSVPPSSNLNYVANQTVPNLVAVGLKGGAISLRSYAGTNVILDVAGYFLA